MMRPIYRDLGWITVLSLMGIIAILLFPVGIVETQPVESQDLATAESGISYVEISLISLLVSLLVALLVTSTIQAWVESNYERRKQ